MATTAHSTQDWINASLRARCERAVEVLIAILDRLDGDPDLEPTMGYVAEGYVDEAEPDPDYENWLGWNEEGAMSELDDLFDHHDLEQWFVQIEDEPTA